MVLLVDGVECRSERVWWPLCGEGGVVKRKSGGEERKRQGGKVGRSLKLSSEGQALGCCNGLCFDSGGDLPLWADQLRSFHRTKTPHQNTRTSTPRQTSPKVSRSRKQAGECNIFNHNSYSVARGYIKRAMQRKRDQGKGMSTSRCSLSLTLTGNVLRLQIPASNFEITILNPSAPFQRLQNHEETYQKTAYAPTRASPPTPASSLLFPTARIPTTANPPAINPIQAVDSVKRSFPPTLPSTGTNTARMGTAPSTVS